MSVIKRQYPWVSPDTVRMRLKLDKMFFDQHVKRSFLREHTNGSKYVGTIENWGSELFLESHKLKMKLPPFQTYVCNDWTKFYFDMHYAPEINSFHQPNAIALHLKKDVISSNEEAGQECEE